MPPIFDLWSLIQTTTNQTSQINELEWSSFQSIIALVTKIHGFFRLESSTDHKVAVIASNFRCLDIQYIDL